MGVAVESARGLVADPFANLPWERVWQFTAGAVIFVVLAQASVSLLSEAVPCVPLLRYIKAYFMSWAQGISTSRLATISEST